MSNISKKASEREKLNKHKIFRAIQALHIWLVSRNMRSNWSQRFCETMPANYADIVPSFYFVITVNQLDIVFVCVKMHFSFLIDCHQRLTTHSESSHTIDIQSDSFWPLKFPNQTICNTAQMQCASVNEVEVDFHNGHICADLVHEIE